MRYMSSPCGCAWLRLWWWFGECAWTASRMNSRMCALCCSGRHTHLCVEPRPVSCMLYASRLYRWVCRCTWLVVQCWLRAAWKWLVHNNSYFSVPCLYNWTHVLCVSFVGICVYEWYACMNEHNQDPHPPFNHLVNKYPCILVITPKLKWHYVASI